MRGIVQAFVALNLAGILAVAVNGLRLGHQSCMRVQHARGCKGGSAPILNKGAFVIITGRPWKSIAETGRDKGREVRCHDWSASIDRKLESGAPDYYGSHSTESKFWSRFSGVGTKEHKWRNGISRCSLVAPFR
ncbi:hypothetical protein BJY52DRAFT_1393684 [Lactarius psammicola]|nr:hypothetical protein BJY52DRAFT_1393684 [Lactarius psammicola]